MNTYSNLDQHGVSVLDEHGGRISYTNTTEGRKELSKAGLSIDDYTDIVSVWNSTPIAVESPAVIPTSSAMINEAVAGER